MKQRFPYKPILLCSFIAIAFISQAQQEYTLTTTTANVISSKALIDLPGLSGNAQAIIIATPLGNTKTMNPHPTGAWYYSGKWNIFNTDQAVMPTGLTYKVQYFLTPGSNQFLHLVTQQNLGAEGSYIDNPVLNNKPNVLFAIFPNHSPDIRAGSWLNPYEAKAVYNVSAGKWYITNIGGQAMQKGCAYNIVLNTGGTNPPNPGDSTGNGTCSCPASLPPNGTAGGDLSGTYPNPTVQKINGFPVSTTSPEIGQVLKWDGTAWQPAADNTATTTTGTIVNKPYALFFNQSAYVSLDKGAVNFISITGLSNATFTLSQNSRIVFHTVVFANFYEFNLFMASNHVWVIVDILNAANVMVARATGETDMASHSYQSILTTGIGILPAGTYHTKVTLNRAEGAPLLIAVNYGNWGTTPNVHPKQGGQMIIQVFPD